MKKFFWVLLILLVLSYIGKNTKKESEEEKNTETKSVTIQVEYTKNKGSYNDDAFIYIDGDKVGSIKAGKTEEYTIDLSEGEHKIHAKRDTSIRKYSSKKIKFNVSNEDIYYFQLIDDTWDGLKMKKK